MQFLSPKFIGLFLHAFNQEIMAKNNEIRILEELLKSGNGGITITLTVEQLKEAFTLWNEEQIVRRQQEAPAPMDDEYLDVVQAATFLNASVSSVRRWAKEGNFSIRRRGVKMYFLKSDLEKYMNDADLVTEQSAGW